MDRREEQSTCLAEVAPVILVNVSMCLCYETLQCIVRRNMLFWWCVHQWKGDGWYRTLAASLWNHRSLSGGLTYFRGIQTLQRKSIELGKKPHHHQWWGRVQPAFSQKFPFFAIKCKHPHLRTSDVWWLSCDGNAEEAIASWYHVMKIKRYWVWSL